jgi:hypothetical protein
MTPTLSVNEKSEPLEDTPEVEPFNNTQYIKESIKNLKLT